MLQNYTINNLLHGVAKTFLEEPFHCSTGMHCRDIVCGVASLHGTLSCLLIAFVSCALWSLADYSGVDWDILISHQARLQDAVSFKARLVSLLHHKAADIIEGLLDLLVADCRDWVACTWNGLIKEVC